MRPKCVNLFPTETKKSTCISFLLCPFTLPAPNSPPMPSSFSNCSPLHFAWPCTQACKTESRRGPRFESGCLQGGGDYSNCHTVYTSVQRKRDSVQNVSHIEKRAGWQDTCVAQGTRASKLWAKELQPKAGRGKVCNQLCLLALWYLLPTGRVDFVKRQALKRRLRLLEVDRK